MTSGSAVARSGSSRKISAARRCSAWRRLFEQAVVGRILDQRVLEAIGRRMAGALGDEEVRAGELIERGLDGSLAVAPSTSLQLVPLPRSAREERGGGD